jgi:hypothetical protein
VTTARQLLIDLRRHGFALRLDGGQLRVKPASNLTEDHRHAIANHKAGLVEILRDEDEQREQAEYRDWAGYLATWDWPFDRERRAIRG